MTSTFSMSPRVRRRRSPSTCLPDAYRVEWIDPLTGTTLHTSELDTRSASSTEKKHQIDRPGPGGSSARQNQAEVRESKSYRPLSPKTSPCGFPVDRRSDPRSQKRTYGFLKSQFLGGGTSGLTAETSQLGVLHPGPGPSVGASRLLSDLRARSRPGSDSAIKGLTASSSSPRSVCYWHSFTGSGPIWLAWRTGPGRSSIHW